MEALQHLGEPLRKDLPAHLGVSPLLDVWIQDRLADDVAAVVVDAQERPSAKRAARRSPESFESDVCNGRLSAIPTRAEGDLRRISGTDHPCASSR